METNFSKQSLEKGRIPRNSYRHEYELTRRPNFDKNREKSWTRTFPEAISKEVGWKDSEKEEEEEEEGAT